MAVRVAKRHAERSVVVIPAGPAAGLGLLLLTAAPWLHGQQPTVEARLAALEASQAAASSPVQIGGYIKLDGQLSRYTGGQRATASIGDDFLVPSTIPVAAAEGGGTVTDFHAKESRFWLKSQAETDLGILATHIELDFLTQSIGDERVTNSYAPRIRHAYGRWNDLLFGQTWSTFFDPVALPELLDFVGPVGTTLVRQAQLRYSPGQWDLAMENPQSTFYQEGGVSSYDDNRYPDLILRYRVPLAAASLSIAALGRELSYQDAGRRVSEYGYGVSVAGKQPLTNGDDLRVQLVAGKGLGRYLGLNAFRGGEIDTQGAITLIDSWSAMVAYRHLWTSRWRSSLALSYAKADNPSSLPDNTARAYRSAHGNLIYSPLAGLDLGGELIWGQRENEDGRRGELGRVQLSAKLAF